MRAAAFAPCALVLAASITMPLAAAAAKPAVTGSIAPSAGDDDAVIGDALVFDSASLAVAPANPQIRPTLTAPSRLSVSGEEKLDGSVTIAIKQALPTDWDTKVGVDLNVAAPPPVSYRPDAPLPGSAGRASSGAAWASVGLPNLVSLDVRINPACDEGHIGTTLQHSISLGGAFALTLRDSYAVTDSLGAFDTAPTAPAGLPVMALPQASGATTSAPVWRNDRGVKLAILPTGTTLAANLASASNDPVAHNTLSAVQKLFGPLHVTTSVSDLGEPTVNKSIAAGFKLNW